MRRLLIILVLLMTAVAGQAEGISDFEQHRGKVILVDFWASWCVPCRRSFPWMNQMQAKYGKHGLVIVAVNLDQDQEDAAAFLKRYPADFGIHYDPEAILAKKYGVEVMPSSVLFGRNGEIAASHQGFKLRRAEEYEGSIRDALGLGSET